MASIRLALDLIGLGERLDGAVLDINLRDEMVFPVADALKERAISFVFATGYDLSIVPAPFAGVLTGEKPLNADKVVHAMWGARAHTRLAVRQVRNRFRFAVHERCEDL